MAGRAQRNSDHCSPDVGRRSSASLRHSPSPSRLHRQSMSEKKAEPSALVRFASSEPLNLSARIKNVSNREDDALGMEMDADEELSEPRPDYTLRQEIWFTLEEPGFSPLARAISIVLLCVISLSVFSFVMGTRKACRWTSLPDEQDLLFPDAPVDLDSPLLRRVCEPEMPTSPWDEIELSCIIIFTIELAVRFAVAGDPSMRGQIPSRREFVLTPLNFLDFIAVVPYYIELVVRAIEPSADGSAPSFDSLAIVRVLRLTRVLRVFKVSKTFTGVVILMRTVQQSLSAIMLLLFFVLLCVVLFAATMFVVEQGTYYESCECYLREDGSQSPFESVFAAGWFCIVTMTTVGYGDVTPVTGAGKVVASLCMVSGLLVISLPITIMSSNFDEEWSQMETDKRNKTLSRLHRSMEDDGKPGITLALLRQLVTLHRSNVQQMLQVVEMQMDDQAAQLDSLMAALREQLLMKRVPLGHLTNAPVQSLYSVAQRLTASKSFNHGRGARQGTPAGAVAPLPSNVAPGSPRRAEAGAGPAVAEDAPPRPATASLMGPLVLPTSPKPPARSDAAAPD